MGNQNKSRKPANDGFSAPAKTTKKAGNKKTTVSVVCMVLVLALFIGVIAWSKIVDNGVFFRNTVSVSSENYEVNNAMLSYYFNTQYQQMASSLQQMGVDTSVNLKNSQYSGTKSWYDFIMEQAIAQVENVLVLCEAAKAEGFTLDDHDKEHIDEAVESIKSMAKSYVDQYGGSESYYIRNIYGYGVNLDDIRDAIELSQIASAYSQKLTDSYEYTEEEWSQYLEENRSDFLVVDYVSYTFDSADFKEEEAETTAADTEAADTEVSTSASDADETAAADGDAEKELSDEAKEAKAKATALYQELLAYKDSAKEIFDTNIKDHLSHVVYADTEDADEKAASIAADIENTVSEAVANSTSSDFLQFAFGKERTADAFLSEDDTNGKYTVYLITKAPYVEEYNTRNIRLIALSAHEGDVDETCEAVLKEFEKGDKSENSFAELAKTYSYDSNAQENGGLYENQAKNDLAVDELSEWLYNDDRAVGDYTHVSNGSDGDEEIVYIVYYVGEGLVKWQRDVDAAMVSEAYNEAYEKLAETYTVESDMTEAYKIPSQAGV